MSSFKLFVCLYFSLFFLNPLHGMLVHGQVGVSPDKSKYIAYLGHYHGKVSWIEAQQLDELVAACREGAQQGKKFHILYEKAGDLIKMPPIKTVLSHLEDVFAEAQVPNCTIENIEIRDLSAAALHILGEREKVFEYAHLPWNNHGSKPLGEITFQDLFDEFEKYAPSIRAFVNKIEQQYNAFPNVVLLVAKYDDAQLYLEEIKKLLTKKNISFEEKVLIRAIQNSDDEQRAFKKMLYWAISALFDLHIFRRLSQLDTEVQPIVITGGMHSIEVAGFYNDLGWETGLIRGMLFVDDYKPLTGEAMRSIILNETEWALRTKDILKYLASIKLSIEGKLQSFLVYLK